MPYRRIFHLVCSCFRTPDIGSFSIGQEYTFECTPGAVKVLDDLGQVIVFSEKIFEDYFWDCGDPIYPVTSLQPTDKTSSLFRLGSGSLQFRSNQSVFQIVQCELYTGQKHIKR